MNCDSSKKGIYEEMFEQEMQDLMDYTGFNIEGLVWRLWVLIWALDIAAMSMKPVLCAGRGCGTAGVRIRAVNTIGIRKRMMKETRKIGNAAKKRYLKPSSAASGPPAPPSTIRSAAGAAPALMNALDRFADLLASAWTRILKYVPASLPDRGLRYGEKRS